MKKQLKELTIKDNFMFGAVMTMPENCKDFLEMVLQTKLSEVVVSKEKSMIYHPEYKGIRLDVYANDEERTHYNVEMQVSKKPALGRRSRYYQSQIDMKNFRILMLFFYVTLTRLGRRNIDTHFQVSAKNVKKANCRRANKIFTMTM